MNKTVGEYRAVPFRMEHGEELESILSAAGVSAPGGEGVTESLLKVGLMLFANPSARERFGRFVASVWEHPLQKEIEDAEDEEDEEKARRLRVKKRNLYKRQPPSARNQILRSLSEQQDFKDFLSSYLSLLPGDTGERIKEEATKALASMSEQLTKLNASTGTETAKSEGSESDGSSATAG